jgi:perosamine synthetase
MTYIAPAGTPLSITDLASGLGSGLFGRRAADELQEELVRHSGQAHCWPIASGRAAMTLILQAMKRAADDPRRTEVVIAGYTCYSVPAAAERAGLTPRLCDINPRGLSPDLEQLRALDFSRVLAIVSANLYGIPNQLSEIEAIAASAGVFMLDDAAQGLGARYAKRAVGGFGDAGLYSFDKGKNITTLQGGAIVAKQGPLAQAIRFEYERLQPAASFETLLYSLKLAAYSFLLPPSRYGMVQKIPGLGLGLTVYETRYPIRRYSPSLAGLALRLMRRIDAINAARVNNAARLTEALQGAPGIQLITLPEAAAPVYTRFPLLVASRQQRDKLIAALTAAGIGATASYPQALADVPDVIRLMGTSDPRQSGARHVAETVMTLPTHAYSPPDLAARVRTIVDRVLG